MIYNKRQNNLRDFLILHSFLDFSAFFLDKSPLGTRLDKDFSHINELGHLFPQFAVPAWVRRPPRMGTPMSQFLWDSHPLGYPTLGFLEAFSSNGQDPLFLDSLFPGYPSFGSNRVSNPIYWGSVFLPRGLPPRGVSFPWLFTHSSLRNWDSIFVGPSCPWGHSCPRVFPHSSLRKWDSIFLRPPFLGRLGPSIRDSPFWGPPRVFPHGGLLGPQQR